LRKSGDTIEAPEIANTLACGGGGDIAVLARI
jgi:hypothetical protein